MFRAGVCYGLGFCLKIYTKIDDEQSGCMHSDSDSYTIYEIQNRYFIMKLQNIYHPMINLKIVVIDWKRGLFDHVTQDKPLLVAVAMAELLSLVNNANPPLPTSAFQGQSRGNHKVLVILCRLALLYIITKKTIATVQIIEVTTKLRGFAAGIS
jgi:hypothetical protein